MRKGFMAIACVLAVSAVALAQRCWGTSATSSVDGPADRLYVYKWQVMNETQHGLYCNGKFAGGYDHEAKHFLPFRDGAWGKAEAPPVAPPAPPPGFDAYMASKGKTLPTGVMRDKLSPKERFSIKGEEVPKDRIYECLGEGGCPDGVSSPEKLHDDSKKPVVSVIGGDDAARAAIVEKVRTATAGAFKVWEGPAADWSFEPGFKKDGKPMVLYVQAADGTVLHRQDDFNDGIDKALEAIRKAVPDYDPNKDPDLRKPPPSPFWDGRLHVHGGLLLAGAAGAAAVVAMSRRAAPKPPGAA
jgi:hypothetical protein